MDFAQLKARFDEARNYKDRWLALYKNLYFYVIPDRDAFNVKFNYRDDGKPTTQMVWDNTALLAAYQRANDLHGLLLPKDRVWGKFVMDPHLFSLQAIDALKPKMDEVNDRIFFYLNESNLSRVVGSSNLDLVGGTAAIWVESIDDDTPLYFRSIPAVALYIEYSTDDQITNCWYQIKMQGRYIREYFPDYNGPQLQALMTAPNDQFTVIYGQIKLAENKFYIYCVLDIDPYYPLWETERSYEQIIVYRDRVRPGEADGRGIGLDLMPTIIDLNRMVEYRSKNYAFKANPPMFYDADSYFNPYSVRQWSGAMIARNPQGRNPLEALQMPTYPDTSNTINDAREYIQKGFQVDPLGDIDTPVKTATEISIRENRAQRTSATDISRLINELPAQIFRVSAKILSERQLLTMDRASKLDIDLIKKLKFDFASPLYDLQKESDLNHFVNNMQIKQQFMGPEMAIASCNLLEVNKFLTDKLNLPSKLFKNDDEFKDFIQQLQQQQATAPQATTSGSQVQLPQNRGVTI